MTAEAFVTALLLTRSPRLAEEAVVSAIHKSNGDLESVRRGAIAEALTVGSMASECDVSAASRILPSDLRWLLQVPLLGARCFVLRFLAGLTRNEAATALRIQPQHVDEAILDAVNGSAERAWTEGAVRMSFGQEAIKSS